MPSLACLFKFAEEKDHMAVRVRLLGRVGAKSAISIWWERKKKKKGSWSDSWCLKQRGHLEARWTIVDFAHAAVCSSYEKPSMQNTYSRIQQLVPNWRTMLGSLLTCFQAFCRELRCSWPIPDEAVRLREGRRLSIDEPLKQSMMTSLWFGFKVKPFPIVRGTHNTGDFYHERRSCAFRGLSL